jgi:pyruvate, water dikinase
MTTTPTSFESPYEVATPEGADGWEQMYNWYHLRGEERRADDEQRFWFHDRLHHPRVLQPYDEIQCECWWQALGAFNTRILAMPPAYGVDQRIINGYVYVSPVPADPAQLQARAELFQRRAGHYYDNWDAIYEEWKQKVTARLREIRAMDFSPLPDIEDESVVFDHRGYSSGYRMIQDFHRLVVVMYETYQYHFEMLNLGYAAYLTFFQFCKQAFPNITDQAISRMVGGLHVDLYRPDDELKRLSKEAVRLGINDEVASADSADALFARLRESDAGREWVADWERTADPWFLFSTDAGHPGGYHDSKPWIEDPDVPLAAVREYVARLREGEEIDRPTAQVLAERERIAGEYRKLLPDEDREAFDEMLELARTVFVYIEEHNIYIEHWLWATFWRKSRDLAAALSAMGAFDAPEDMFLLRRSEVAEAIYDIVAAWSVGSRPRGADYWRPIIAERRRIYEALKAWDPPPALGPPPEEVNEPFTVMLWGITTDQVAAWLSGAGEDGKTLQGQAGSPGVVEGPARIVKTVEELDGVQHGEVLICPATSPSWSPVFSRVVATVSDVGGVMSHAAIICREYGLPAVVGTGGAVRSIATGQRVRVDGDRGIVTILE